MRCLKSSWGLIAFAKSAAFSNLFAFGVEKCL